jgi:hypothetical protein
MKTQTKFTDKQIKEFRSILVKSSRNTISNIQIRLGFGYQDAKLLFGILNSDKKFVQEVLKFEKRKPKLIQRYTALVIKEIKKTKDKNYIVWSDIRIKVGIKYEFDRDIRDQLKKDGYILEEPVYLIKKDDK